MAYVVTLKDDSLSRLSLHSKHGEREQPWHILLQNLSTHKQRKLELVIKPFGFFLYLISRKLSFKLFYFLSVSITSFKLTVSKLGHKLSHIFNNNQPVKWRCWKGY